MHCLQEDQEITALGRLVAEQIADLLQQRPRFGAARRDAHPTLLGARQIEQLIDQREQVVTTVRVTQRRSAREFARMAALLPSFLLPCARREEGLRQQGLRASVRLSERERTDG